MAAAGIFKGQTADGTPLTWVLTLTGAPGFPSAFGASDNATLLIGTFEPTSGMLTLRESLVGAPVEAMTIYRARQQAIAPSQGVACFAGTVTRPRDQASSSFYVLLVDEADASAQPYLAGTWVGAATPAPELAPFAIPTNPIQFAMAVPRGRGPLFGAGFFDDAADVEGQPVLCFAVTGSHDGEGNVSLRKLYEASEARHYDVRYDGRLRVREANSAGPAAVLEGAWTNATASTHGNFRAQLVTAFAGAAITCAACLAPLADGAQAATCYECFPAFVCCGSCAAEASRTHATHALHAETVYESDVVPSADCTAALVQAALVRFRSRPLLGLVASESPSAPLRLHWHSYAAIGQRVFDLAASLDTESFRAVGRTAGDDARYAVVIGELSLDYAVVLLALVLRGYVLVPLAPAMGSADVATILAQVRPQLVVVSAAVRAAQAEPLQRVLEDAVPVLLFESDIEALCAAGAAARAGAMPDVVRRSADASFAVLFTSGSTDRPKGTVYSESLVMPTLVRGNTRSLVKLDLQAFHPSYAVSLIAVLAVGGARVMATDLARLFEATALVRPTHLSAPPVVFAALVREHGALLAAARARGEAEPERCASRALRLALGNRMTSLASGGAPIAPHVLRFCRERIGLHVVDLYGAREAGPIAANGIAHPGVYVALVERGADGSVRRLREGAGVRGELAVHSSRLISGYFRDVERTNAAFTTLEDGRRYYLTGDVGECYAVDGTMHVRLCGRMAYGKTANAHWLEAGRLEAAIESLDWVRHALVCASPDAPWPVALVVPRAAVSRGDAQRWTPPSLVQPDSSVDDCALVAIRLMLVHIGLGAQAPARVHVLPADERWDVENGLLTATLKMARAAVERRYASEIAELFAACSNEAASQAAASARGDASGASSPPPVAAAVLSAVERVLGRALSSEAATRTLVELGADSLALVQAHHALRALWPSVTLAELYVHSLAHLGALYELACAGAGATMLQGAPPVDWAAECSLESDCGAGGGEAEQPDKTSGCVVLTGATGFLGPWLAAAVLASLADPSEPLVALVRAADDSAAERRMRDALAAIGCDCAPALASGALRVLAADVCKRGFGLSRERAVDLTRRAWLVIHNAAEVSMQAPYARLRMTTVAATRAVLDFAVRARARLALVSSVAVLRGSNAGEQAAGFDAEHLAGLSGYAAAKLVSELLCNAAATQRGLRVNIFRLSDLCGATGEAPACATAVPNKRDFLSLLIRLMLDVGAAPTPAPLLLHWAPVDWAAQAVVRLAGGSDHRVFHLAGAGPSLDALAEALQLPRLGLAAWREAARAQLAISAAAGDRLLAPLAEAMLALDFARGPPPVLCTEARAALGGRWFGALDVGALARGLRATATNASRLAV